MEIMYPDIVSSLGEGIERGGKTWSESILWSGVRVDMFEKSFPRWADVEWIGEARLECGDMMENSDAVMIVITHESTHPWIEYDLIILYAMCFHRLYSLIEKIDDCVDDIS